MLSKAVFVHGHINLAELGGFIVDGKHVLFGALLALIASLIVCVEIILLFEDNNYPFQKKT